MKIKLQNKFLPTLIPLLQGMKLKGEQSRARSKFLALAMNAYYSLHDSEIELLKEYAILDKLGEPLSDKEGGFTIKEDCLQEYFTERGKLFSEVAELQGATYTKHIELMRRILLDYDEELCSDNAALYDALLDAIENEMEVCENGKSCD